MKYFLLDVIRKMGAILIAVAAVLLCLASVIGVVLPIILVVCSGNLWFLALYPAEIILVAITGAFIDRFEYTASDLWR